MWISKEIEVDVNIEDFDIGDVFDWVTELCNKTDTDKKRMQCVEALKDDLGFNSLDHITGLIYSMDREKFEELLATMHNDYKYLDGGYNCELTK